MTGTAMLALDMLCGPNDKAILMDLHRNEFKTLSENVPGFLKVKGIDMDYRASTGKSAVIPNFCISSDIRSPF